MTYEIIRNERDEEREGRDGRIRTRHTLTWDVVRDGVLYRECRTRKEATREAKELNATLPPRADGRKPIVATRYPRNGESR